MPITNINRYFVGEPNIVGIVSTDLLSAITTAGYFASQADAVALIQHGSFEFTPTDIILIYYQTGVGPGVGFFTYDIDTDTFTPSFAPGEIILPVVAGHFANWANTGGTLEDAGYSPSAAESSTTNKVAIVGTVNSDPVIGNLAAFLDTSGTIGMLGAGGAYTLNGTLQTSNAIYTNTGGFVSYATVQTGSLGFSVNPSIIHSTVITTVGTFGQATQFILPDPDTALSTIALFPESPVTYPEGHLVQFGSVPGTIVDSDIDAITLLTNDVVNEMQPDSEIIFDHVAPQTINGSNEVTINNQAGCIQTNTLSTAVGAAYTFTLNNSLLTADSIILLQSQYGTNTTIGIECTLLTPPDNGSCQITLNNNSSSGGPMNGNMKIYFFIPY